MSCDRHRLPLDDRALPQARPAPIGEIPAPGVQPLRRAVGVEQPDGDARGCRPPGEQALGLVEQPGGDAAAPERQEHLQVVDEGDAGAGIGALSVQFFRTIYLSTFALFHYGQVAAFRLLHLVLAGSEQHLDIGGGQSGLDDRRKVQR